MEKAGTAAKRVVDRYAYWQEELAGENHDRDVGHDNICGFWRVMGAKTKPAYPVAIYPDENGIPFLKVGRKSAIPLISDDGWDFRGGSWLKCEAVTHEAYKMAVETGFWPDGVQSRKHEAKEDDGMIGHNSDESDPYEALKRDLEDLQDVEKDLLKKAVTDKDTADKVGTYITKFRDLANRGNDYRVIEKKPHLDAGRAVDAKWNGDICGPATESAKALKKHLEKWLIEQKRIADEEARKAREEAERKRLEEMQNGEFASEPQDRRPSREEKPKSVSAGRTGAKVGLRTVVYGEVTDYALAAKSLLDMQHPDLIACIDSLADRAAKAKMPFPGMVSKTRETVV